MRCNNAIYLSFVILLLAFSNGFADRIHSYQELASAMREGDLFVIVIDIQECTGNPKMPLGYFTPSKMLLIPAVGENPERIVTSDLHFTDYSGNPTYEYIKYTFKPDNTVQVRTTIYAPATFSPTGKEHEISCVLGRGIEIYRKCLKG